MFFFALFASWRCALKPLRADHLVAALALGFIEALVGLLDEGERAVVGGFQVGHARREGHRNALSLEDELVLLDDLAQLVGEIDGVLVPGLGQDQRKLLAAVAGEALFLPN